MHQNEGGQREFFKTRAGFILAAVGSAVGLGNMWRFPYVAAEGGGAAFVVLYIFLTLSIGIPLMLSEFSVGRGGTSLPHRCAEEAGWQRLVAVGIHVCPHRFPHPVLLLGHRRVGGPLRCGRDPGRVPG
ncbi:hypothetical protein ACFL3Z_00490 [Gemmatimonadota bacterium]